MLTVSNAQLSFVYIGDVEVVDLFWVILWLILWNAVIMVTVDQITFPLTMMHPFFPVTSDIVDNSIRTLNVSCYWRRQEPSLYTVKAVLILDNDGDRLYAKVRQITHIYMVVWGVLDCHLNLI